MSNAGFEHLLHLRRQTRAHLYRLCAEHPEPLVPLKRCHGVRGRLGPDGELEPLALGSLPDVGDAEAVAVCLLWSILEPAHELEPGPDFVDRADLHIDEPGIQTDLVSSFIPREDFEPQLISYFSPPKPGKLWKPEQIANAIAYLASDDARMINGAVLVCDGGTLA
jgi:hypothetical protein